MVMKESIHDSTNERIRTEKSSARGNGDSARKETEKEKEKTGLAQVAKKAQDDGHIELWHSADGEAYVTCSVKSHRENYKLKSKNFRRWLQRQYYLTYGKPISAGRIEECIRSLEPQAIYDCPKKQIAIRVGGDASDIYLDLTDEDWRVVKITADGWQLTDNPTIKFLRCPGSQPLPVPIPGGDLLLLRPFVNVGKDEE